MFHDVEPIVPPGRYQDYFADPKVHQRLLADHYRLKLFRDAMAEIIHVGSVVMDLGAGTGVLTRMALALGAGRVVAVEQNRGLFLWNDKLRALRAGGSLELIEQNSLDWDGANYSNAIDVVVSETIGTFGVNEGILALTEDAGTRFLKKSGVIIPKSVGIEISLAQRIETHKDNPHVMFCSPHDSYPDLHYTTALTYTTGNVYCDPRTAQILVPPGLWDLLVVPTAQLTARIHFDHRNEPASFGTAIIPLPVTTDDSTLLIKVVSTELGATADIEFTKGLKYGCSFKWRF